MKTFKTVTGENIDIRDSENQLKIEHVLQRDRDVWKIISAHPYLAIDFALVQSRLQALDKFAVFSAGQLWQNFHSRDLGARLAGMLIGGGTDAGMGVNSGAFVRGRANAKARHLRNWNPLLILGTTPWVAEGTHFVYVDGEALYQHQFAELIVVDRSSRPSSPHFDFNPLAELRNQYNSQYLNGPRDVEPDLDLLSEILDQTFLENAKALAAAEDHHQRVSPGMTSNDYESPTLTKYDRLTHDHSGQPQVEIAFALLHYEKAIVEFNALKTCTAENRLDDILAHGVYCVVAAAACIEAIANRLVHAATGSHPTYKDKRQPLIKINDAATALTARNGGVYQPLKPGTSQYDSLDQLRELRNGFMHAKELETDIDPHTSTSETLVAIGEASCRAYLAHLREAVEYVFSQLQETAPPIVTKKNVTWMGQLEVP